MFTTQPKASGYFRYLLSPFFWPWWALFSGIASIASWFSIPITGFNVPHLASLVLFTLLFAGSILLLSVMWQGWRLYRGTFSQVCFVGIQSSAAYDGDHVVLLTCGIELPAGTLLELQRTDNGVEVPIALIEVRGTNSRSQLQAHPVWFGPGHLNDLMKNTLSQASVRATPLVSLAATQKAAAQLVQDKANK